ncbi:MAG: riboflavin synthase [Chitinophagaceae bacterium]|nr:MAG: riboflavin synthase [Chitinophagaceae bacterium]
MFTGIIENTGVIESISEVGRNKTFTLRSSLAPELKVDQSLSHDGVCLTVEEVAGHTYRVTAVAETLQKTCLNNWKSGYKVNLERSMLMNGRLDGHIVQGHIDSTANCISREDQGGSTLFTFETSIEFANLIIEKGSICINGVSLTVFNVNEAKFSVAVIPYTMENTNIGSVTPGVKVNVEFDVIGKYVQKMMTKP